MTSDARAAAVRALTALARQSSTLDGPMPTDFAADLSAVVTAVAANIGSTERLLAGGAGSWQTGLVRQLVTVPDDQLWRHRDEPVVLLMDTDTDDKQWQTTCSTYVEAWRAAVEAELASQGVEVAVEVTSDLPSRADRPTRAGTVYHASQTSARSQVPPSPSTQTRSTNEPCSPHRSRQPSPSPTLDLQM